MIDFLWSLVPWGYEFILALENLRNPLLNAIFEFFTFLGNQEGIIVVFAVVYWSVSKPLGKSMGTAYLLSATINMWLKDLTGVPRPADPALDPVLNEAGITSRVSPLTSEESFSFPSGHSQNAVGSWGLMAARFKETRIWITAIIVILMTGISRIWLGVHFPQDVIGGWLIGIVFLAAYLWAEPRVTLRLKALPLPAQIGLAVVLPLLLFLVDPSEGTATPLGALIGALIGFIFEPATLRFSAGGTMSKRALRTGVGLIVVFAFFFGLSALDGVLTEGIPVAIDHIVRIVRYAGIGFLIAWIAPWGMLKLGWMDRES
jgi:undecaprenyl-diphosphatase